MTAMVGVCEELDALDFPELEAPLLLCDPRVAMACRLD